MKASIFNKTTGEFMYYGSTSSPKYLRLIGQGHTTAPDFDARKDRNDPKKIDPVTSRVVVDEKELDRKAKAQNAKNVRTSLLEQLAQMDNKTSVEEQLFVIRKLLLD